MIIRSFGLTQRKPCNNERNALVHLKLGELYDTGLVKSSYKK